MNGNRTLFSAVIVIAMVVFPLQTLAAPLCKVVEGDTVTLWGTGSSNTRQAMKCVSKNGKKGRWRKSGSVSKMEEILFLSNFVSGMLFLHSEICI